MTLWGNPSKTIRKSSLAQSLRTAGKPQASASPWSYLTILELDPRRTKQGTFRGQARASGFGGCGNLLGMQWPPPSPASVQGIGNPGTQGSQEREGERAGPLSPRGSEGGDQGSGWATSNRQVVRQ